MTSREAVEQLVRACIKAAYSLTDEQVIKADSRGPRPPPPYLSVRVDTVNVPIGEGLEVVQSPLTTAIIGSRPAGSTYTLTVDGTAYSYVSLVADTPTTIALALAALVLDVDAGLIAATDGVDILIYSEAGAITITGGTGITVTSTTTAEIGREGVYSTATVQGYGAGADAWLEGLPGALMRADVAALQLAAGVDLEINGGLLNVSQLLDTAIEPRWARSMEAAYTVVHLGVRAAAGGGNPAGSPIIVPLVPLLIVEIGYIGATDDSDADPATLTITPDLT